MRKAIEESVAAAQQAIRDEEPKLGEHVNGWNPLARPTSTPAPSENPINRYAFGDRSNLKFADGSWTPPAVQRVK